LLFFGFAISSKDWSVFVGTVDPGVRVVEQELCYLEVKKMSFEWTFPLLDELLN
jgi:hypothetical protein